MVDEHGLGDDVRADGGDDAVAERRAGALDPGRAPGAEHEAEHGAEAQPARRSAESSRCRPPSGRRSRTARRTRARRRAPARMASQSQRPLTSGSRGGHGGSPNGDGRPSLPGLRMPCGSSAALTRRARRAPAPRASATKRARLMPDAVVVRQVAAGGEHGALAGVPQRDVRRLDRVRRRRGGEREVQAGAVGVAVRQVAAGDAGVLDASATPRGRRRTAPARRPTGGDLHRVDDEALAGQALQRARCRCGAASHASTRSTGRRLGA